jgi:hypothetical protein
MFMTGCGRKRHQSSALWHNPRNCMHVMKQTTDNLSQGSWPTERHSGWLRISHIRIIVSRTWSHCSFVCPLCHYIYLMQWRRNMMNIQPFNSQLLWNVSPALTLNDTAFSSQHVYRFIAILIKNRDCVHKRNCAEGAWEAQILGARPP